MSGPTRPHPLRWLPPFLVGTVAATAAEVAGGLLLYTGPGLVRSLTVVLAVCAGALGLGLALPPAGTRDPVDGLRRRWLLCLGAFLLATVYSASWSAVRGWAGTALSQGLGLAFLGGLPLYACGGVLGAMGPLTGSDDGRGAHGVGGAAVLGTAFGFLATGLALPMVLAPASLLLACLVLLSGAGLIYGSVLDRRVRVDVLGERPSPLGDVRVEDRVLPAERRAVRVLLEGRTPRRWTTLEATDEAAWEMALFQTLHPAEDASVGRPVDVLVVGGGASTLARTAPRAHPAVRIDVVERSAAVVELGRHHLETGLSPGEGDRVRVDVGNVDDLLTGRTAAYDLVIVDTAALAAVGGPASVSQAARARMVDRVGPAGVLAFGPSPDGDGAPVPPGWSAATFTRARDLPAAAAATGLPNRETVVVCWNGTRPPGLAVPHGFRGDEPAPLVEPEPTA